MNAPVQSAVDALRVAVIGCGPAGLATALLLERDGHAVTMLERFTSPQPLGSGIILQPTGLAVLRELGLAPRMQGLGSRLDRILGIAEPSGRTVLDVDYQALGDGYHGTGVHRAALFEVLYDAVLERPIELRTDVDAVGLLYRDESVWVTSGSNQTDSDIASHGPFDLVVDASGANSTLRRYATQPAAHRSLDYGAIWGTFDWPGAPFHSDRLEQRYVDAHTMIGVLPIGRHAGAECDQVAFFWSLKRADYAGWVDAGLGPWKQRVRKIWPDTVNILDQITDPAQMTMARYGHLTLARPYGRRIVFIGDAAHSTSPQLGQGANMALLDAWALASALRSHGIAQAAERYARSRRWHVRAFQLSSLAMTPFYQSDSRVLAKLRDLLFDPVSKLPLIRRIVAGLISGLLAGPPGDLEYRAAPGKNALHKR